MLPTVNEFVRKYKLEDFIVVADSGLMNNANIAELEAQGYKYIIGAKIKNESAEIKDWILRQPKYVRPGNGRIRQRWRSQAARGIYK